MSDRGVSCRIVAADGNLRAWLFRLVRWLFPLVVGWRPQQDSNLRTRLRRPLLYPLSYGGFASFACYGGPAGPVQGYQS